MTRRRFGRARRVMVAFGVGCAVLFAASGASAPAASSSIPIKGGGSWGAYRELLKWQNDLSSAKQPLDLSYTAHGTLIGRQEFLSGTNDFVLSGVPFTPAELAKVPGGASGIIDAPVQVSTLGFLLEKPAPDGLSTLQQLCDPDDPNTPDPSQCLVKKAYDGPVKLPVANLGAMALQYTGTGFPPLNSWNDPAVLKAMGVANFTTPPLAGPAPVKRSDPDEINYYLQQYVATHAPSVWNGIKAANPAIPWDPITERLPRPGASRDGVDQQGQQLALGGGDPTSGTINQFTAGVFAPVPPSALSGIKQAFPDVKLEFIQIQNANGDWVEPTTDSINAAVDAGGATPLYALNNKVPGAYPLVWIDHLYAPAHGLTIQKTEAMAAMIRYLATAGQSAAKPVGEGRLSAPLTAQALNAANQLVSSNCTGGDRHVETSTDPGPDLPDLPAVKTIGMMQHCVTGAPADTSSPDGGFNSESGTFDSTGTSSGSSSGTVATGTSTTPTAAAASSSTDVKVRRRADGSLIATSLPLPAPATSGGVDRLATLLLGVGLYFLLRKPVRKLLAKRSA